MIDYLSAYLSRRQVGLSEPISIAANSVADDEVARLLTGESSLPIYAEVMKVQGRYDTIRPRALDDISDEDLAASTKELLRYRALQGLHRYANSQRHQESLSRRVLQAVVKRTDGIRLVHGKAGVLLVTHRSRLRGFPMDPGELSDLVGRARPPYKERDVISILIPHLVPENGSGGYCYLADLIRAIHLLRYQAIVRDGSSTGAAPYARFPEICRDGVPFRFKLERLRKMLATWVREMMVADDTKKARRSGARGADLVPGTFETHLIVEIVIDRILAPAGLGRPEWADLSLERLAEVSLGASPTAERIRVRGETIDYLVRRIRKRLQKSREMRF